MCDVEVQASLAGLQGDRVGSRCRDLMRWCLNFSWVAVVPKRPCQYAFNTIETLALFLLDVHCVCCEGLRGGMGCG